jgi:hypothetical protein
MAHFFTNSPILTGLFISCGHLFEIKFNTCNSLAGQEAYPNASWVIQRQISVRARSVSHLLSYALFRVVTVARTTRSLAAM